MISSKKICQNISLSVILLAHIVLLKGQSSLEINAGLVGIDIEVNRGEDAQVKDNLLSRPSISFGGKYRKNISQRNSISLAVAYFTRVVKYEQSAGIIGNIVELSFRRIPIYLAFENNINEAIFLNIGPTIHFQSETSSKIDNGTNLLFANSNIQFGLATGVSFRKARFSINLQYDRGIFWQSNSADVGVNSSSDFQLQPIHSLIFSIGYSIFASDQ